MESTKGKKGVFNPGRYTIGAGQAAGNKNKPAFAAAAITPVNAFPSADAEEEITPIAKPVEEHGAEPVMEFKSKPDQDSHAESNASPLEESTPVPVDEPVTVPEEALGPTSEPVPVEENNTEEDTITATPPVKSSGRRGRPPKAEKKIYATKKRTDKECTSIYFEPAMLQQLRLMHVIEKRAMSDIVTDCLSDMMNRTYQCSNAACNFRFTVSNYDDLNRKPSCCPSCKGEKIKRVKFGI